MLTPVVMRQNRNLMVTRCTWLETGHDCKHAGLVLGRNLSGSPAWCHTCIRLHPCGVASLQNHRPAAADAEVFSCCFVHLQARDESLMANASIRIGF